MIRRADGNSLSVPIQQAKNATRTINDGLGNEITSSYFPLTKSAINPLHLETTYGTNTEPSVHKYFTISGDGLVVASCSAYTGATSSYGTTWARIYYNGGLMQATYNRIPSAIAESQYASACAIFPVSDGDKIHMYLYASKYGNHTFYWDVMCVGCTATETSG